MAERVGQLYRVRFDGKRTLLEPRRRSFPAPDRHACGRLREPWPEISAVAPRCGARIRHQIAPGRELTLIGDVGGFGAASEFSWQAVATYGFDVNCFGSPLHTVIGYRTRRRFQRGRQVRQERSRRRAAWSGDGYDVQLVEKVHFGS